MGINSSKISDDGLYSTPKKIQLPEQLVITVNPDENGAYNPDPRSPHVCRTPIQKATPTINQSFEMLKITSPSTSSFQRSSENPSNILKNKLIKDLQCNLNDPRSPSQFIDRTPIVFDDESECCIYDETENSFDLNEKLPNLAINNDQKCGENVDKNNSNGVANVIDMISLQQDYINRSHTDIIPQEAPQSAIDMFTQQNSQTPIEMIPEQQDPRSPIAITPEQVSRSSIDRVAQQQDPRSPTIGVERTPLIFSNNDDVQLDPMIESVEIDLETISTPAGAKISYQNINNKELNRVKNERRSRLDTATMIYEDNHLMVSTPKKCTTINQLPKRTPLSCVANKSHLRSRSVENSNKSKRFKLPTTSYDDYNVNNFQLRITTNNENIE